MIFQKLVSLFKRGEPNGESTTKQARKTRGTQTQPGRRVEPSRIGDIGEYKIEVQLRQLPKEYRHLNDLLIAYPRSKTGYSQIDHVLITPYAVFVIETKNYQGYIRGKREDVNWRVNGRFPMYNPVKQNRTHINALKRVLADYTDIKLVSVISFTKRCELRNVDQELREIESDELVVYDIKLTDYIKRKLRRLQSEHPNASLTNVDVARIHELLSEKNITDAKVRAEHIEKASRQKTTNQ